MNFLRSVVLAIDDEPENLIVLKAALRDCAFDIVTAGSGQEGIELLREREFAAILLDIQMPEMDGFETALWVRARGIQTPIVLITATTHDESYAIRGYEAGAVDFLFKPINIDILRAKLSVLVDQFESKRELEIKSALLTEGAERRYRDLVEGIPNGIVWTSPVGSGVFNYVSSSALEISGYSVDDWMTNKNFLLLKSHPEDTGIVDAAFAKVAADGGSLEFEHRVIRADGSTLWMHTNVRMTDLPDHQELRGLSFDITSLKQTEQSLRETIVIRDEFLSIASHELKTPLTPLQLQIEGFQRLAKRGELHRLPPETMHRMLDVSAAQIDTLSRLVNQLLDVSLIKAGRVNVNIEEVDVPTLIRKAVDVFETSASAGRDKLNLSLPEKLTGRWDAARVEQVFVNLIDNAIKYGLGKPISITLKELNGRAEITVSDQGIGISPEDQKRIFHRFERAVSNSNYSGMGLGLFITQQIVDLHGGQISVVSRLGHGSTFKLSVPLDL